VPGPNVSLYFAGAKQISTFPVSIPYHGMALNITLQGYNGWLDFGLIGCRRAMPDIANLAGYMQAAHVELLRLSRELVAPAPVKAPTKKSVKTAKPAAKVRKRAAAKKPTKAKARAK
jgi:diacylglycerol O-acyltransferase